MKSKFVFFIGTKNKNYNFLYVITQGFSEQATNFYEKNSFKLINQIDIFHLWKK
jgi:hypothetical protein